MRALGLKKYSLVMYRPSEFSRELESFVDTFITRWDINHGVASKLIRCSPEVQWEIIASKPPRKVYNPNGLVMNRIAKARGSSATHLNFVGLVSAPRTTISVAHHSAAMQLSVECTPMCKLHSPL